MKITARQLRRIIREEVQNITEGAEHEALLEKLKSALGSLESALPDVRTLMQSESMAVATAISDLQHLIKNLEGKMGSTAPGGDAAPHP